MTVDMGFCHLEAPFLGVCVTVCVAAFHALDREAMIGQRLFATFKLAGVFLTIFRSNSPYLSSKQAPNLLQTPNSMFWAVAAATLPPASGRSSLKSLGKGTIFVWLCSLVLLMQVSANDYGVWGKGLHEVPRSANHSVGLPAQTRASVWHGLGQCRQSARS